MVVAVLAVQGQTVNANQTTPNIVKIADLDTVTVKAQISEADVVRVKPGQPAYFTILGEPDKRYSTTLRAIEPAPDSIATDTTTSSSNSNSSANAVYYNGLLDVPNSDGHLRISMTAKVSIVLAKASKVIAVPLAAVIPGRPVGSAVVRVVTEKGEEQRRAIKTGLDDGSMIEVKEGLAVGDKVVVGVGQLGAPASPWQSGARRR